MLEENDGMMKELIEAQKKLLAKQACSDSLPPNRNLEIDDKALDEGGFPLRHRLRIPQMKGRGLEVAERCFPQIINGESLFVLSGDRGRGKTQIAVWWGAQRTLHGKSPGRYSTTSSLIGDIKATWNGGGRNRCTEADLIKRYEKTPYLVLDEFHERGASDWEAQILLDLIDHRYYAMKCTVIICSCKAEMLPKVINSSITDRANETGGLIECDWKSYRTG